MSDYIVKLRFWVRAYDSTEISAATDVEAYHLAKVAARDMMAQTAHPGEIHIEERREGLISYIDRIDDGRHELAEAIVFDGDRPLHPEARRMIRKLDAVDGCLNQGRARELLRDAIAEARAAAGDPVAFAGHRPAGPRPWSIDQAYEYRGNPKNFVVRVVDKAGVIHALDPRIDLRNHSPSGFSWGYPGSGPAQLALAILCHALHSDPRAEELYQEFKNEVISRLDQHQSWQLTTNDVLGWVLEHPSTAAVSDGG